MKRYMVYKGYVAIIEFDSETNIFHGEVTNMRDVVTCRGKSVEELRQALIDSVNDYLDFCAQRGEEPYRGERWEDVKQELIERGLLEC